LILFWAIYHACILFAGLRGKHKSLCTSHEGVSDVLPKFSLLVPVKDEGLVIDRCLRSLMSLNYPRDKFEIIVVEGGSTDETARICSKYSSAYPCLVRVVSEKVASGKPSALNLALPFATGDLVGVFDADSVPEKDVLLKMSSYFSDPSVSAVQGSTSSLNENQNMLTKVAAMEDKAWSQGLLQGRENLHLFVTFTGSCQFIRTEVLRKMGGWEESSLTEDLEFSLRLVKHGLRVKYAPDVSSGQETPFCLRSLFAQRVRWYRGYMESSLRYGSLLEKINRRVVDAEISLIGPFVMVVCLASYLNWGASLLFSSGSSVFPFSAAFVVVLNSVTLFSLGIAMAVLVKPVRARNLFWVPFVYAYWLMQMLIATKSLFLFLFRRRRTWEKTIKSGIVTEFN
jgi:cellulose synthase/poly-beta-1,6-N-acetylglucosamine synthase-like glycosyltransferase